MRIMSQNGEVNLPYEMTAVLTDGNVVKALFAGGNNIPYIMATYENEEKCQKALKMLDGSYTGRYVYHSFTSGDKPKHMTFRFPKDDEI